MKGNDGLILWVLGGAGCLFVYAAYKNKSPQSVLADHLNGTQSGQSIVSSPPPLPGSTGIIRPTSYTQDVTGEYNVIDGNGMVQGVVPKPYQGSAGTFIPRFNNNGVLVNV